MCGIFAIISDNLPDRETAQKYFMATAHRGPDKSQLQFVGDNAMLGFHRLSIIGVENGDQPITYEDITLMCNGEIYNYLELCVQYGFEMTTESDCEIILHMYKKFGLDRTLKEIDGVFAFILHDPKTGIFVARDPIGIRPLYSGTDPSNNTLAFASEMKSISFCPNVFQFNPGHWWHINVGKIAYFTMNFPRTISTEFTILGKIRRLLKSAVKKRMISERPIATLLSGGVDSSIIAALVQKYSSRPINTYSIGMEGSPDLKYAEITAKHIGSVHKNLLVKAEGLISGIPRTILQIESYDTTTVRASVANYIISKWISQNSPDKVIFCGDVADEIFGGYRGFSQAPTDSILGLGITKMLSQIHYFDVLRSDRSISGAGLEARVPYADKEFIQYIMSIDPSLKRFGTLLDKDSEIIEKRLLRTAFSGKNLIPDEVLWRRKEAFSDGVSGEHDWFALIQEHVEGVYTDEEFEEKRSKYVINQPYDKESLWYREIFESVYPGKAGIIPCFWKQPFCTEIDPSARKLECY